MLPVLWDYLLLVVLGGLPIVLVIWYFVLISRRNMALEALSSIDVQLNLRLDLIPNILKIARRFMEHEKDLMTEVTELRQQLTSGYNPKNAEDLKTHLAQADELTARMGQLMIQVENYPQLTSDQTMVKAMESYNEVEARIAASRRFFNASVTALNNAVQIFPGSLIAKLAGVSAMPYFEARPQAHDPIDADDFLGKAG
ncbi:MAG: LemA family protein [Pseudomonadota bacterium]